MTRAKRKGDSSRVLVLPTRFGLVFAGVAVLTLIGCINYQLSLGYALTFLMLSLWVVSAVHAFRSLTRTPVALTIGTAKGAFAGEPLHFPMTLTMALSTPAPPEGPPITVRAAAASLTIEAWPNGEARESLRVPSSRRGLLPLPVVQLIRHDALGLWRAVQQVNTRSLGLVYPAPEKNAPLPPESAGIAADAPQQRVSGDEDFHGLRPYQRGDAPGRIAWRQAARTGALHTRVFDAPGANALHLSWEATEALRDPEARLSRLAAWVLYAEQHGKIFELHLPGEALPVGSGSAQVLRALSTLALYDTAQQSRS